MHPPSDHGSLLGFVSTAEAALTAAGTHGAILRISDLAPPTECFTWFPLGGTHPLDVLVGFVAPPHWQALGVSCHGRAHSLPQAAGQAPTAGAPEADPVVVTLLLDRAGNAAGVMRRGDELTTLRGRPEGVVADACRRALALPTSPPPPSTLGLWTAAWLDRVVELAGRADAGARLRSWPAVVQLHAAAGRADGRVGVPDPEALARAAHALARAWPWARLRADPVVVDVPGPPPSPELAAWMDDGMWARSLLSRLPGIDDLLAAVRALLPSVLADDVERVTRHCTRAADR